MKIFIVDDDIGTIKRMQTHLQDIATLIQFSDNYEEAYNILLSQTFDCIICDYELSFRSEAKHGIDLIQELRAKGLRTPMILLTAKDITPWAALNAGGDDFIRKPYTPQELVARVLCAHRKMQEVPMENRNLLSFEEMVLDIETRRLYVSGKVISIPKTPFLLLVKLIRNQGKILSYSLLQEYVWGKSSDTAVEEKNLNGLRVHMFNLKNILERNNLHYLHNIHGLGYQFAKELTL